MAAHDATALLGSLLEQSVVGIYILDGAGAVAYINAHFAELSGYSQDEMIGRSFSDFVADEEVAQRRGMFADVLAGKLAAPQTVGWFKRKTGEQLALLTQSTVVRYNGSPALIGIAVDVTDRFTATQALGRANHALQILGEASIRFVHARDEGELLQGMCDFALATGAYSLAWVGRAEADKSVSVLARSGNAASLDYFSVRWDDSDRAQGPTGTAIRTGSVAIVRAGDSRLTPWMDHTRENPDRVVISFPLFDDGRVFGSLTLASRDPQAFGPDEVAVLEQLANNIAYGMAALRNRAALHAAEERSRAHASRLEVLWRIATNPTLTGDELTLAMLAETTSAIRPGFPFMGSLFRISGDEVVVEAVCETPEYASTARGTADLRAGLRIGVAGTAVEGVLELGNGTHTWDDLKAAFDSPRVQSVGWRSTIATTFESGRSTYLLWFASVEHTGSWETEDRAYVEIAASFFASQAQMRWQFSQLQYHQTHDVLTGLFNRSQFRSQARMASTGSTCYAVIVFDVNAFADVNKAYGNMIGDALLVEVAAGLAENTLPDEIAGRLSGDTFVVFIPEPRSHEFVRERAQNFVQRFARPFSTGDREGKEFVTLSACVGMAMAPEHGTTLDALITRAGIAVAAAKARGHGTTLAYEPSMDGDAEQTVRFRNELALALADNQFELYFQPHLNLRNGEHFGCEALIRWRHPERGLILPGEFIPLAERLGLIDGIDTWVMHEALRAAQEFGRRGQPMRVYFNLSGRHAGDPKVVEALRGAAAQGLSLGNLGIEITETDAMRDFEATRAVCLAARELGVRIALDDFGTGYSSLTALRRLPVDLVKIDRSFVAGILDDRHDAALVETIIQMARIFGCDVLAEGVEREAEIDWLRERECTFVQGYAIAHPLPIEAFTAWLKDGA
ncbi:MAG TPA: EAL domain-containing protein [Candidatus Lustribacter sp.]|nr:EAL domain-containing protein [Candidatus Lustribacter sp.]